MEIENTSLGSYVIVFSFEGFQTSGKLAQTANRQNTTEFIDRIKQGYSKLQE